MKLQDLKPGSHVELTIRMNVRVERISDSHGVTIKVEPKLLPGWTNRETFWIDEREVIDCVGPGERRSVFVYRTGDETDFVDQLRVGLLTTEQWFVAEKLARASLAGDTGIVELRAVKEALDAAIKQRDLAIAARDDLRRHLQGSEEKRHKLTAQLDTLQAKQQLEKQLGAALAPIAMRIHCPDCGNLHIDEGEFATKSHHTHACQACGLTWRPAIVPTVGVRFLPGFKNESEPPRASDGHAFQSYAERGPPFDAVSEFCQRCGGSRDAHTKG